MSSREDGRHKTKNHAQDCRTLTAERCQRPAILPWFLVLGWRPSFRFKSRAACPLRPAAGLPLDVQIGHDAIGFMPLRIIDFPKPDMPAPERSCKNARQAARVYFTTSSTANVVLFDQRVITRFVLLLEIIEKRTACGDHFQQATT